MAKGPFKRTEGYLKPRRTDHLPGNPDIFEKRGDSWLDKPPKQPSVPPRMSAYDRAIEAKRRSTIKPVDIPQFATLSGPPDARRNTISGPKPEQKSKFYVLEKKGTSNKDEPVYHPALALRAKSHKTHEREMLATEDRSSKPARPVSHRLARAQARLKAIRDEKSRVDLIQLSEKIHNPTAEEMAADKWKTKGS